METIENSADSAVVFTDSAARKVKALIDEEGDESLNLRVFISGGGCSGFQYGFTFDEKAGDGDTIVENSGVKLLIDPMSIQYLMGAEIDYTEGLRPELLAPAACQRRRARGSGPGVSRPGGHSGRYDLPRLARRERCSS